jgi:hypothetical protein
MSDFDAIQALVHLSESLATPRLVEIVAAIFEQITCIGSIYNITNARESETKLLELEQRYDEYPPLSSL